MASDPIGHGLAFWDEEKAKKLQKVGDKAVSACKGMEIQAKADKPFNSTARRQVLGGPEYQVCWPMDSDDRMEKADPEDNDEALEALQHE